MRTWLITWNVERWPWDDDIFGYKEMKAEISHIGHAYGKWTCGVNKSIQKGDRIFMIKLGSAPKGIVASGYALSEVFEGIHWDIAKRCEGKKARRIYIDFDKLLDYEIDSILTYDELKEISSTYNWSTQSSGIEIPESIANSIEEKWRTL